MKKTRAKVFDNLDPKVRDKLKSYDAQTGVVLNAFERLLIDVTRYELGKIASFNESGTQFTLHQAPDVGIPIGEYYFKSAPRKAAHQYRYTSQLCEWVIDRAKNHYTPPARVKFQIEGSDRATAIAKWLKKQSGRLRIEEVAFTMRAGKQQLRESCLITAGFLSDGTIMDQEQIRDLLDLNCAAIITEQVDDSGFSDILGAKIVELSLDVEGRNAGFFLQQEDLIEAARRDHKATFDAKIREYQAKETAANKAARKATNAIEELKFKQEARQWRRKIDDAEDEYRVERNRLREESEKYLDNARDTLNATETKRELFTINWEVQ